MVDNNKDDDDPDLTGKDNNRDRKNSSYDRTEEKDDAAFRYALCNLDYSSRLTLTTHYDTHRRDEQFKASFRCPECRRNKVYTLIKKGFVPWLKHLKSFHGERYTPHFQQNLKYPKIYLCPLLTYGTKSKEKRFNSRGLTAYFTHGHVEELDANKKDKLRVTIQCRLCISQGAKENSVP